MPKTFAGEAAKEVGDLAVNLQGAAAGFRAVTQEAAGYVELQKVNVALAREKAAIIAQTNAAAAAGRGGTQPRINGPTGGGDGTIANINGPAIVGGGVLASVGGPATGSGVLASVNGPGAAEIVKTLKTGFASLKKAPSVGGEESQAERIPTAGDRQITRTLTQGFASLERVLRSGRNDGGAGFRSRGGV